MIMIAWQSLSYFVEHLRQPFKHFHEVLASLFKSRSVGMFFNDLKENLQRRST